MESSGVLKAAKGSCGVYREECQGGGLLHSHAMPPLSQPVFRRVGTPLRRRQALVKLSVTRKAVAPDFSCTVPDVVRPLLRAMLWVGGAAELWFPVCILANYVVPPLSMQANRALQGLQLSLHATKAVYATFEYLWPMLAALHEQICFAWPHPSNAPAHQVRLRKWHRTSNTRFFRALASLQHHASLWSMCSGACR